MFEHHQSPELDSQEEVQYEHRDVSYRGIVWSMVTLGIVAVLVHLGLAWMFWGMYERYEPVREPPDVTLERTDRPRLQPEAHPSFEMRQLRERDEALLHAPPSRVPGHETVIRMPIERAMRLVLEEGLPGGEAQQTSAAQETASEATGPSDAASRDTPDGTDADSAEGSSNSARAREDQQ